MKNFSLLYEITRPFVMPAIRVFYKKIQIKNFKNLPVRGGVLICSNHVNAFMDPVSIQLHTSRQLFSLARGDAFNKPFLRWLLTQWKLIPIYRLSEGAENLKKNDTTFLLSQEVLTNGNPLIIYPEAICIQERRIRKLKKGAARIAFGVEEQGDFKEDLLILPVGLNYSNPKKFRSNLFINFGKPIHTSDYIDLYKEDKVRAINRLTLAIEQAMKELVVHIEHKDNDELVEKLFEVYKPELLAEPGLDPDNLEDDFKESRRIADAVNQLYIFEPQKLETIRQKLFGYILELKEYDLRDNLLTDQAIQNLNRSRIMADYIKIAFGMFVFLPGLVMNYVPYKIAYTAADKLAKEVEFHASINMTIGWFSWIAWYLLELLLIAIFFRSWLLLGICALLVPLSGIYALNFYPFFKKCKRRRKLLKWSLVNKTGFENLTKERKELIQFIRLNLLSPSQG